MICATYARKSNSDSEAVERQIAIAADFIRSKGWPLRGAAALDPTTGRP
jgi:DNA invertase Pin-like site-specific DNA recombinase